MMPLALHHHGQSHGLQMRHCTVDHLLWDTSSFRHDRFLELVRAAWFACVDMVLHVAPQEEVKWTKVWRVGRPLLHISLQTDQPPVEPLLHPLE